MTPDITPLIFIFITYYYLAKKKTLFLKQTSCIYFIIFVTLFCFANIVFFSLTSTLDFSSLLFGIYYQFHTFKNPIFSTHFNLGVWVVAWLLSPLFDSALSAPGRLYLLPAPFFLYPTLWIYLCVLDCGEYLGTWLVPRSLSLLFIHPFLLLVTSVSFLPLLFAL